MYVRIYIYIDIYAHILIHLLSEDYGSKSCPESGQRLDPSMSRSSRLHGFPGVPHLGTGAVKNGRVFQHFGKQNWPGSRIKTPRNG